ncbi:hypothetical protein HN807_05890 [Candidatus Bathyarchaeota archaeon]|nr:hypothetical protein [Candidatus Bathyarchaeota archaeon]
MKPWLLNILACPIDKHHPLEAYFYSWETPADELAKINSDAGKPNTVFKKQYGHLAKQIADDTISLDALKEIRDQTDSMPTAELYIDVNKFIERLVLEDYKSEEKLLSRYPEGLDILYRYLNLVEVEEGLIRCPKCDRWYPIGSAVETIPELMPDDLREEERDMEFLKKWESKLPDEVKTKGKPFSL